MNKQESGDWQTPIDLARAALARVAAKGFTPATVIETTCGEGSFLVAAADIFPVAQLCGYEINDEYVQTARAQLPTRARVLKANFFAVEWESELAKLDEPILIAGNPPWVTNSTLGTLDSANLPEKRNFKGLSGFDAMTGKSNFDVSEWMILRLLAALQGRRATVAVLCKTAVARRVIEFASTRGWDVWPGGLWRIDAMTHFHASVDATLFVCETGTVGRKSAEWPVYTSLDATRAISRMEVVDGILIADAESAARTSYLVGRCEPEWRSGIKHDCSRVMELEVVDGALMNGLGERVQIEAEIVFPLLKSSDVANGRARQLFVIVPQRALGDDTTALKKSSRKAWKYLSAHADLLRARKSSIYRGQPDFAIFGVGPYSFAPWKVAISGMYKRCEFTLVGPQDNRPVMLDDTCYFLPFDTEAEARRAWEGLRSPIARDFFAGRIFWDAKRPVSKAILQRLDLHALINGLKQPAAGQSEFGF